MHVTIVVPLLDICPNILNSLLTVKEMVRHIFVYDYQI
jgi:hypothetical protein